MIKNPPASVEDSHWTPGWGRSPGEGNAAHSSVLAWRIPWTEEPGSLQCPRGHKESDMTERLHFTL